MEALVTTDVGSTLALSPVAVVRWNREYQLILTEAVAAEAHLFSVDGNSTTMPTRHSVQIGPSLHIDLPDGYGPDEILDRFYWRFMNHSCEPSAIIRGLDVLALRPIQPGEEVTFDYNTTEYEMAEPFECRCGSANCVGLVRGYRFLADQERDRLRPWVARHLLSAADDATAEPPTAKG